MYRHICVETNFLIGAFDAPHKRMKDAERLWKQFVDGEVSLHVPFVCLREAQNKLPLLLSDAEKSLKSVQEIRRHLQSNAQWNDAEVRKFASGARQYMKTYMAGLEKQFECVYEQLRARNAIIDGENGVFDLMSLSTVRIFPDYNDYLVMVSVLHCARSLNLPTGERVLFCTMDRKHFAPEVTDPCGKQVTREELKELYDRYNVVFQEHFRIQQPAADGQ